MICRLQCSLIRFRGVQSQLFSEDMLLVNRNSFSVFYIVNDNCKANKIKIWYRHKGLLHITLKGLKG